MLRRKSFRVPAVVLAFALASLAAPVASNAAAACSGATVSGGEWPSFAHDLRNSRSQSEETTIGAGNVAGLTPAWTFSSRDGGGIGAFQSTPVIADGCMFVTSASISTPNNTPLIAGDPIDFDQYAIGWLYAVDVATGKVAWTATLGPVANINFFGGVFAPSVSDGVVHVLVGSTVPYAMALDEHTGAVLWRTALVDPGVHGALASAVTFKGLVFAAVVGGDASNARTPFYILDANTGAILTPTYCMPLQDWANGYAGGGTWTTAAVDTTSNYAYLGMSNPYGSVEGDCNDSIIKIDVDRTRATFGQIVGTFKHTADQGKDLDFGASPNLLTGAHGEVVVGDLQKSGEYHAADAATMSHIWTASLAAPNSGGNAATAAYDGSSVYVASDDGKITALDALTGAQEWSSAMPDLYAHYEPTTVANGVVYTIDTNTDLLAYSAADGALLLKKQLSSPAGNCVWSGGGGVAVAEGLVFAACDKGGDGAGVVVAYKLG